MFHTSSRRFKSRWVNIFVRRLLDLVLATVVLVIALPALLLIALAIVLTSPGSILFAQKRAGLHGKPFRIYKFRTMHSGAQNHGPLVTSCSDPRITRVGALLRRSKLDELPQLINVFNGTMSFFGPRPLVLESAEQFFEPYRSVVFSVKPGITSFTQLVWRNEEAILGDRLDTEQFYIERIMPEKLKLDAYYVQNRTLSTDLCIMLATGCVVAHRLCHGEHVKDSCRLHNGRLFRYLKPRLMPLDAQAGMEASPTSAQEVRSRELVADEVS